LLDPRYQSKEQTGATFDRIQELLETVYPADTDTAEAATTAEVPSSSSDYLFDMEWGSDSAPDGNTDELAHFFTEQPIPAKEDILQWWSMKKQTCPRLYKMAIDYLACPASSVPAERANSAAKCTFAQRFSLNDVTFKAEMCTRSWNEVLSEKNIAIPSNPKHAYDMIPEQELKDLAEDDIVIHFLTKNQVHQVRMAWRETVRSNE
jgi:hAT family C-terminal dimerisation region